MRRKIVPKSRYMPFLGCVLLAFVLAGCGGIRIISDYDETTDKSLTAIQEQTDAFISALVKSSGTEDAAFEKNKAFYDRIDQQLRQLEFRVNSIPRNEQTIALVKKIRTVILGEGKCSGEGTSLRDLHCMSQNESKGPSATSLEICRRNINQTISAALSLELAKKQGLEKNK